jgi:hypothetical protein
MRIADSNLGNKAQRQSFSDKIVFVEPGADPGVAVQQFDPKIKFVNLKRTNFPTSRWMRSGESESEGWETYSVEKSGYFSSAIYKRWIPADVQRLVVFVTSDCSTEFLRPEEWPADEHHKHTSSALIKGAAADLARLLEVSDTVVTEHDASVSFKNIEYSEAHVAVFVRRYAWGHLFLVVFRPVVLTTLGFVVFVILPCTVPAPLCNEENQSKLTNHINVTSIRLWPCPCRLASPRCTPASRCSPNLHSSSCVVFQWKPSSCLRAIQVCRCDCSRPNF